MIPGLQILNPQSWDWENQSLIHSVHNGNVRIGYVFLSSTVVAGGRYWAATFIARRYASRHPRRQTDRHAHHNTPRSRIAGGVTIAAYEMSQFCTLQQVYTEYQRSKVVIRSIHTRRHRMTNCEPINLFSWPSLYHIGD